MHGLHSQAAARDLLTTRRPSESPASSSPRLRGTPKPDSASQGPAPPPAVFLAGWSGRGRALRDPEAHPPTPGLQPPLHPRGPLRDPAAAAADPSHPPGGCKSEPPRCTETPLLLQRRRSRSRRLFGRAGHEEATPAQVRWSRPPPPPPTEKQHFSKLYLGTESGLRP